MASVDRVRIQKPSRSQVQLYNLACAVPELSVYSAEASEIPFIVGFAEGDAQNKWMGFVASIQATFGHSCVREAAVSASTRLLPVSEPC